MCFIFNKIIWTDSFYSDFLKLVKIVKLSDFFLIQLGKKRLNVKVH